MNNYQAQDPKQQGAASGCGGCLGVVLLTFFGIYAFNNPDLRMAELPAGELPTNGAINADGVFEHDHCYVADRMDTPEVTYCMRMPPPYTHVITGVDENGANVLVPVEELP